MGQFSVTHKCGHAINHTMWIDLGTIKRLEAKRAWLETTLCAHCRLCIEQPEVAAEAARLDLPLLEGTDKQITWANGIRLRLVQRLLNEIRLITFELEFANLNRSSSDEKIDYTLAFVAMDRVRRRMLKRKDASVWIDERDTESEIRKILLEACALGMKKAALRKSSANTGSST